MGPAALIPIGLSIWNGIQGSRAQGKANQLQQQALNMALQQYADRSPFRQQALNMMGSIEGDTGLPSDFGINTGNPYARQRVNTAMAMPQTSMTPQTTPQQRLIGLSGQMRKMSPMEAARAIRDAGAGGVR